MDIFKTSIFLAACIVLCLSHPTPSKELPVLKEQPAEILFKADNYSTVVLECVTEKKEQDVKYTWYKYGEYFDWKATGRIEQRPGEGSIMIFNPQPQDDAIYQCFAETKYGIASTRPISLKMMFLHIHDVETKYHKPVYGKPFKLDCYIPDGYPKPTVIWKTQLRSDPSVVEDVFKRTITASPDGTLWFSNVTEADVSPSFKYICVAVTPAVDGVILAEHFLEELVPSNDPYEVKLVPQYLSNDMKAQVGNVTMIYCIYGGTPMAFPTWYKDGKIIDSKPSDRVTIYNYTSGKRLLIKNTLPEDEGIYTCEVYNGVGEKQTHDIKVTVVSAPEFVPVLDKQLNAKKNQDIKVPCQVTGVPEPKITWTYNAKPLDNVDYKNGILTLRNIKESDTGYYGCKAKNEYGVIYAETLVNVE